MMHALDRERLATLARHLGSPAISLTMPLHRPGTDAKEDRIRFKNLIRIAEERMISMELRATDARKLLEPARDLLDDVARWRSPGAGVAVFIAPGEFHAFRLEHEPAEQITVSDMFHVLPVLAELRPERAFNVLALSQNRVRLLHGDARSMEEVAIPDAPESLAEALRFDDFESQLQFHSRTPAGAAGRARRSAVFHGHGGTVDTSKEELERFFRMVERGVTAVLRERGEPLVLAGVDYLLPVYRAVNDYSALVDASIVGNADELSLTELHARATEVLEPHFDEALAADLRRFDSLMGTGAASDDLGEIVSAAHQGRVDVLFIDPSAPSGWGMFDPTNGHIETHAEPAPGDRDLADLAAMETILHGGVVHALTHGDEPGKPGAIFRF